MKVVTSVHKDQAKEKYWLVNFDENSSEKQETWHQSNIVYEFGGLPFCVHDFSSEANIQMSILIFKDKNLVIECSQLENSYKLLFIRNGKKISQRFTEKELKEWYDKKETHFLRIPKPDILK